MKRIPPVLFFAALVCWSSIGTSQIVIRQQIGVGGSDPFTQLPGNGQLVVEAPDAQAATADSAAASDASAGKKPNAALEKKKKTQLKKLAKLTLNRLPSNIMQTWSKAKPSKKSRDLPPAPEDTFLYNAERFDLVVKKLERDFTLGKWDEVSKFLKSIPKPDAKKVYAQMLSAASGSNARKLQSANSRDDARTLQPQHFSFEDLFSLAEISPEKISDKQITTFSQGFRKTISAGRSVDDLITRLNKELEKPKSVFTKRQVAKLLFGTGHPLLVDDFLPPLDQAKKDKDYEALNLLSRHYLAIYAKDKKKEDLENAWHVTQAILASDQVDPKERKLALARAVKLSSDVSEELGKKWLNDSFVAQPETGMEVLGAIGADTSKSLKSNATSPSARLDRLKLQNDAVAALLKVSAEPSPRWDHVLELLAMNWIREAEIAYTDDDSTQLGPSMQRDTYGNIFYYDYRQYRSRNGKVTSLKTTDLLEIRPSNQWLDRIDPLLKPKFDFLLAQLFLKVSEQDLALPYIEKFAKTHPKKAESLINEFITVWTTNHDPNSSRGRTSSYMYMYGYESRAESIPLTRSKQKRNLEELADVVKRLRGLTDKDLDEKLLVNAFVRCHSTAEVYKLDEIEQVFGSIDKMKPKTIANITSRMRRNLATMWRDAKVQNDKKTKRKKPEIEKEVVDGYALARKLTREALAENPDEWSLVTTNAELLHDENNYRADMSNSSEFSTRRDTAMKLFQNAAKLYATKLPDLEEKEYTTRPFETWFYASLGACDLNLVTAKHRTDSKQIDLIKTALEKLPGKAAQWHMSRFANLLFNRMSSVKPTLKQKYLDLGFQIVGDHKQAKEAQQVHQYYKDLVTEIKLETTIDGDARVGHNAPFGVHVHIRHTKEIERESGGFGRYLQNQNNTSGYSYNYGRPTQDYRDKFEEMLRETYAEQFNVLSVTFQESGVKSFAADEEGWRITPYAYVLLEANGPEVDKLPPLKLDLDFLDTSGYVILPVESPALPIDASERMARPFDNVSVTQILDERQSGDGKLILEVKATGQGLMPELDQIVSIDPEEFEVSQIDDEGVSVSRFDPDERLPTINSSRTWLVSMAAKPGVTQPESFQFPQAAIDLKEIVFQRYVDADLEAVDPLISLQQKYETPSYAWVPYAIIGGIAGLILFGGLLVWFFTRPEKKPAAKRLEIREDLSPFAAISILQHIESHNGFKESKQKELAATINRLEEHFFGDADQNDAPDYQDEVKKWAQRSKLAV